MVHERNKILHTSKCWLPRNHESQGNYQSSNQGRDGEMTNDEKDFERWNRLAAEKVLKAECSKLQLLPLGEGVERNPYLVVNGKMFNPCTSIADAWIGVEKMTDEGFYINIYPIYSYGEPDGTGKTVWCAEILGSEVIADTAPLAITTACLLAKGVEV